MQNRRNYALALLTAILAFNYVDRFALGIAAQDIKRELAMSDTQIGFLSGIAFAMFYAVGGIPIARMADSRNRIAILSISTAIWSAAVCCCALAANFVQLALIRVVVGIGEAGCLPPSHSLLADLFNRAQRPRAISVYMQGVAGSLIIGYFAAGWLNQYFGWRVMFILVALPGSVLSALAWWTLADPRRTKSEDSPLPAKGANIGVVCATLWKLRTFRAVLFAFSLICFFSYGVGQWAPAYFVRTYGLPTGVLGSWLAAALGLSGIVGTYCSGEWAAGYAACDERRQLMGMAVVTGLSGLLMIAAFIPALAPNYYWAFGWLALGNGAGMMVNGPTFAVLQTLVPEHMRATSVALVLFFINLVGLGCGPWITGALSDALQPWMHAQSLRYAIMLVCPSAFGGAWYLFRAARTVARDLGAPGAFAEQVAERG